MEEKKKRIAYMSPNLRKTAALQSKVSQNTYQKVLRHCNKNEITVSNFIRELLEKEFSK